MRPWERAGDSRLLRNERGTDMSPSAPGSSRGHILELQESGVHELQPESSLGRERESRSSLVQAKVVPMALLWLSPPPVSNMEHTDQLPYPGVLKYSRS